MQKVDKPDRVAPMVSRAVSSNIEMVTPSLGEELDAEGGLTIRDSTHELCQDARRRSRSRIEALRGSKLRMEYAEYRAAAETETIVGLGLE